MKRIIVVAALALPISVLAQSSQQPQPSLPEQVDRMISMERDTANTALTVKNQIIADLMKQLEQARKDAQVCKPKEEDKKSITAPVPSPSKD